MSERIHIENAPAPERRPVYIGGLPQNFYLRALKVSPYISSNSNIAVKKQDKYFSMEEIILDNGIKHELVEKDYPINVESVSSYIESSDYRNDPAQAIAGARKRINLGDISQAQEFLATDPIKASSKYSEILQKVADYFKAQEQTQNSSSATPSSAETNEVK